MRWQGTLYACTEDVREFLGTIESISLEHEPTRFHTVDDEGINRWKPAKKLRVTIEWDEEQEAH